jgi:hypothetical protein
MNRLVVTVDGPIVSSNQLAWPGILIEQWHVPAWKNRFAVAGWLEWLRLNAIDSVAEKIAAPTLFIHSDGSALPDNVQRFYRLMSGPREMYWSTQGAQTDYYDQEPYVSKSVQIAAVHFKHTLG